jgi:flagellar hook-associated protein 2
MDIGTYGANIDVDKTINKLLEVERQPLYRIKAEIEFKKLLKKAYEELENRLYRLDKLSKRLYGIEEPFSAKRVVSSAPSIITAKANKYATKNTVKVRVIRKAKRHTFHSDSIPKGLKLPKSTFTIRVGKEIKEINFLGGNIIDLKKIIEEKANTIIQTSLIEESDDSYILVLSSKKTGIGGEVILTEKGNLFEKIGIFKPDYKKKATIKIDFKKTIQSNGVITIFPKKDVKLEEGDRIVVKYKIDSEFKGLKNSDEPMIFVKLFGKVIGGFSLIRKAPKIKKGFPSVFVSIGNSEYIPLKVKSDEAIYYVKATTQGTLKNILIKKEKGTLLKVKKIMIYNERKARLSRFKHIISKPENAILEVNGIKVERETNHNINDIVKGISLDIHSEDKEKVVELKVENDIEKAVSYIKDWVEAYNKVMEYINDNIRISEATRRYRGNRIRNYEDYLKEKLQNGLFVGDLMAIELKNILVNTVSIFYPNKEKPAYHSLYEIGIFSGNQYNWREKKGKLEIDEGKLRKALRENPISVRELFGSDNNNDFRVDNGVAFNIRKKIRPYITKAQRGILSTRLFTLNENIKSLEDRANSIDERVRRYEERLRYEFYRMQRVVESNKNLSRWLENQLNKLK